jgi:DNA-binding transcriptional MerR regulator
MSNRRLTIDEIKTKEYLKMTELAELNGVRYSTVKYYAELGLLPFEQQGKRLARKYKRDEASTKLQEILRLREQGKSVTDIINLYIKNP